jgi:hypothetical protein
MKMLAALFLPFMLSTAYATEAPDAPDNTPVSDSATMELAQNIGYCQANNNIFINVALTGVQMMKVFESIVPTEEAAQYKEAEFILNRAATIQKIQNDVLAMTIPQTLAHFPNMNAALFNFTRETVFKARTSTLLNQMKEIDPVDKARFAAVLEGSVEHCLELFHPDTTAMPN